ncbi:MAG: glycoside hydrolase family 65 protein, partial [Terracoccus sp.]
MKRSLHGSPDPIDRSRFPVDEWAWRETWHNSDDLGVTETVFAVGNGYLGMRGNAEEGRDVHAHGTFVNGFHETWRIRHAEEAFGFAQTGQTIVNVPDVKTIKVYVDDEPLMLSIADLEHYERTLDFRDGVLRRSLVWRTPSGKRVRIESRRMVSFEQRHLAVMTFDVTLLDADAPVAISSQVLNRQDGQDEYHVASAVGEGADPRKASQMTERVLEPQSNWTSDRRTVLSYRCANSGMTLAVGVDHELTTENDYEEITHAEEDLGKKVYRIRGKVGRPIRLTKVAAYHTSRGVPVRELVDRTRRTLDRVRDSGVEECFAEQRQWLDRFWADSDVRVDGHPAVQQAVRWNLFQLAQASGRVEQSGIAAKGVSGSGYEGHYFWDTETYVLPFLTYTSPQVARGALRFRYLMLPAALRRAKDLSHVGALFPWRTINGEEASAYYAAGTAQYHINADIAFALCKYVQATGDDDFMLREGIDILVLTARMWADLGFWLGTGDQRRFHLHGVTGPDEYTTVVNNNLFTNVMARYNLEQAVQWVEWARRQEPREFARLAQKLRLTDEEVVEWAACAEGMHIPFDEGLGIHPQDDFFLDREVWDLSRTPEELRPLLLHYHPLVIYR